MLGDTLSDFHAEMQNAIESHYREEYLHLPEHIRLQVSAAIFAVHAARMAVDSMIWKI